MTHRIAQLFGEAEDKIAAEIAKLEASAGYPRHDVSLLGQNARLARQRIAELGLDPEDTTAQELHHALRARFQSDARRLEADLGLAEADAATRMRLATEAVYHALGTEEMWTLKNSTIKQLLKTLPPRKTKKSLGYRSIDSMLKRSNPVVILAVARALESATWQTKWSKLVQNQSPAQHETGRLKFYATALPKGVHEVVVPETATVVIAANDNETALSHMLRAVDGAQKLAGKDLSARLASIHPSLRWWMANAHLVAWQNAEPVSFNIFDVSADHHADIPFEERSHQRTAHKLMQKLSEQYDEVIDGIETENLKPSPVMVAAEVENV